MSKSTFTGELLCKKSNSVKLLLKMMVTWCYLSAHLSSRINLTLHRLKMNVLQPLIIRFHHVQNLRLYLPLNVRFLRWGESLAAFRDGRALHQLNTAPWRFGWQERRRNGFRKKTNRVKQPTITSKSKSWDLHAII